MLRPGGDRTRRCLNVVMCLFVCFLPPSSSRMGGIPKRGGLLLWCWSVFVVVVVASSGKIACFLFDCTHFHRITPLIVCLGASFRIKLFCAISWFLAFWSLFPNSRIVLPVPIIVPKHYGPEIGILQQKLMNSVSYSWEYVWIYTNNLNTNTNIESNSAQTEHFFSEHLT